MKTAGAGLITHLGANNRTYVADLYTLELTQYLGVDAARGMSQDGTTGNTTCKWTTGDTDLNGFACTGPSLKRGGVRQAAGVEVSTMDLELGGAGWTFPNGRSLAMAAVGGAFDGAHVKVERLFMATWGDLSLGAIHWFEGAVASVEPTSTQLKLTFKSDLERLNLPMPRRLFQPGCPYALFDAGCGLAKVLNTNYWNKTLTVGGTSVLTFAGNNGLDYFKLGSIKFTSGPNLGLTRAISTSQDVSTNHQVTLAVPLPVAAGTDTVVITRGCDKTYTTCVTRFANGNRFGGFPFVPKPESIR